MGIERGVRYRTQDAVREFRGRRVIVAVGKGRIKRRRSGQNFYRMMGLWIGR